MKSLETPIKYQIEYNIEQKKKRNEAVKRFHLLHPEYRKECMKRFLLMHPKYYEENKHKYKRSEKSKLAQKEYQLANRLKLNEYKKLRNRSLKLKITYAPTNQTCS